MPGTLGELISGLYDQSLRLVGLGVFGMFLYAGINVMLTGDTKKAKKIFQDAAIGVVLLYSSVMILNSINEDLTSQQSTPLGGAAPAAAPAPAVPAP